MTAEELDRDRQERLERPGNIMVEGEGAGNGQNRVEKVCWSMCRQCQTCTRWTKV